MRKGTGIMKTPKPLLALRMVFPLAASLIALLLGEWIARGWLSADVFAEFIFPHIGAYLLAWLLLFLVWLLLDWVYRCPPLSTLGMAVLGIACITNMATGIAREKHSHQEVLRIANESSQKLCALVERVVREL